MLDLPITRGLTIVIAGALAACSSHRIDQPLAVASGFASYQLCSEVFISDFPANRVYEERIKPTGAFHLIAPFVHYQVDTAKQQVTSNIGGAYQRRAVY